jgi:hypothetical protein
MGDWKVIDLTNYVNWFYYFYIAFCIVGIVVSEVKIAAYLKTPTGSDFKQISIPTSDFNRRDLLEVELNKQEVVEKREERSTLKTIDGLHISPVNCINNCSQNGICCDAECHCFPGFKGTYCQTYDKCHGIKCGYGVCNIHTGVCDCNHGYTGSDCEMKICPENSIYDIVLDKCVCDAGWGGESCSSCQRNPNGHRNKTYVCCPTGLDDPPFTLIGAPTDRLQKYLGGYVVTGSCVMPNKTDKSGYYLDCSCREVDEETVSHPSNVKSNLQTQTSKVILMNMYKRNLETVSHYSRPEIIGDLLESQYRLSKSTQQVCDCNDYNYTGVMLLVSVVIVIALILLIIIYVLWSRRNKLRTKKDDPKRSRNK